MLINSPREFVIELPGQKCQNDRADRNYNGNCNQNRSGLMVETRIQGYLFDLQGTVDEQPDVAETDSNNLNCVFETQSIVDQN